MADRDSETKFTITVYPHVGFGVCRLGFILGNERTKIDVRHFIVRKSYLYSL